MLMQRMSPPEETEAQQLMADTIRATDNSLALLQQVNQQAETALTKLEEQGDKLNSLNPHVTTIMENEKIARHHARGIFSVFGGIRNWFSGTPEPENIPLSERMANEKRARVVREKVIQQTPEPAAVSEPVPQAKTAFDFFKKSESGLTAIYDQLQQLQITTDHIQNEVAAQNDEIPELIESIVIATDKIDDLNALLKRRK
jgi:peptidoglycan hydrolase CwlO-like protein